MSPLVADAPYWVLDAVLGALGGLVGWLATWTLRKSNPGAARAVIVAAVVIAGAVGRQFVHPLARHAVLSRELATAGRAMYGNERAAALNVEQYLPILDDPALPARLAATKAGTANKAAFEEITHLGLGRLPLADIEALFDAKRAMAARSPVLCAAFWTGDVQSADLTAAMKALTPAQQRTWITVSARAALLELHASAPAAHIADTVRANAFATIARAMTPAQLAAFTKPSATPPAADACGAFKSLADALGIVGPEVREPILRAINNPELFGP